MNRRSFIGTLSGGLLAAGCQQAGLGAQPSVKDSVGNGAMPPTLPTPVNHLMSGAERIPENLGGVTVTVGSGAEDLYTALGLPDGKQGATPCLNPDGTHRGNTYVCPAGATYSWFKLPVTTGPGWTCIRADSPTLPAFGTRITEADAPKLFRIVTAGPHMPDSTSSISIGLGSNGWRIVGAEVAEARANTAGAYGLIFIAGSRVCIERCWIHGTPTSDRVPRGIYITSERAGIWAEDIQIWDTRISDIKHFDQDNQGIYMGLNRRTHIENCYVSGTCMNIMIGTQGWGQYGEDVVVRRCHLYKPPQWFQFLIDGVTPNPVWDQHLPIWSIKNIFETKNARRVLMEGNIFENEWRGPAITHNTQELDLTDVTYQHNVFLNCRVGWSIGLQSTGKNYRIKIYNNLWMNIVGMLGWHTYMCHDLWVEHNTVTGMAAHTVPNQRPEMMGWVGGPYFDRYTFRRNIIGHRRGGFYVESPPLDRQMPQRVWTENAIYGTSVRPEPSFVPFASYAAAGLDPLTGKLTPTSRLRVGQVGYFGTDGKNIGVDFEALSVFMHPAKE